MRIQSTGLFLGLALSLVGCEPPTTFHGDASFSEAEREAIEQGARWMAGYTGRVEPVIVWDGPHLSAPVSEDCERNIVRWELPTKPPVIGTYHWASDSEICVYIGARDLPAMRATAAHEFGHFFGLDHHAGPGIMNANPDNLVWTAEDQTACEARSICRN